MIALWPLIVIAAGSLLFVSLAALIRLSQRRTSRRAGYVDLTGERRP